MATEPRNGADRIEQDDGWEPVDSLHQFGFAQDYLAKLDDLGVRQVRDLPWLVALAFEPFAADLDTVGQQAYLLLGEFGRQLYDSCAVPNRVEPQSRLEVEDDLVIYSFALDCSTIKVAATARLPLAAAEAYLSDSHHPEQVTEAFGAIQRWVDPLSDLEYVLNNIEKVVKDNQKQKFTRKAMTVLAQRFGLAAGSKRTLASIGAERGVTRELIRQNESKGLKLLHSPWATIHLRRVSALVEHLAQQLEVSPADALICCAMRDMFPQMRDIVEPWLKLLAAVNREKWAHLERDSHPSIDHAVAELLARRGEMSLDEFVREVADHLGVVPSLGLQARIRNSPFCTLVRGDIVQLAETADSYHTMRRLRRLSAMRQVLETKGPLHFTDLAGRIHTLLGPDDVMTEHNVHAWLDRYDDFFVWVGKGTYRMRRPADEALQRESLPERYAPRRRRGIGDAIVALLLDHQPRSLAEIESHIIPHFIVNRGSVRASIMQDARGRFVMAEDHQVFLSDADICSFQVDKPRVAGVIDWNEVANDLKDFAGESWETRIVPP